MSQIFFIPTEPGSQVGSNGDISIDEDSNVIWGKVNGAWEIVMDPGTVGTVAWGHITGTLDDQGDLSDALVAKADRVSPVLVTPNLGTPTAGVLTSCTGLPATTGLANIATASLLGRTTASTGAVEVITQASLPVSTATQTALNLKQDLNPTPNAQTGTSYTLVLGDNGKLVTMNNASASTLTVPLNATVAYPVGASIAIFQLGAGQVTVTATGGVTISSSPGLKLSAQYVGASLIKISTDAWVLMGSLSA